MIPNTEISYGGFFRRLVALVIDAVILVIPCLIAANIIPFVGAFAVAVLYYPVFDSSPVQATPGRFIMGLRVTHENGQRLDFSRALVRHLMAYVSGLLMGLGYLIQLFTEKRQTLHDIVAGALVLKDLRVETPNWIQVWLEQMKVLLAFDETKRPTQVASPQPSREDALNQIQKLQELLKSGALTEEEFQEQKSKILESLLKS
ncbi:MAG: RDD family protein [Bdellovibrionales bacterium]